VAEKPPSPIGRGRPSAADSREATVHIDTSYQTMQRDLFASGMVAQIGVNAFAIWQAIKAHADFETGVCWPSVRRLMELTGLASRTVQTALTTLQEAKLLRVRKHGRRNYYIACERMDVRIGPLLICTVVVDYIPMSLRDVIPQVRDVLNGKVTDQQTADEVLARIELIPGPGFRSHAGSLGLRRELPARELGAAMVSGVPADPAWAARIERIRRTAETRGLAAEPVDNDDDCISR
jgi:DNA-binding IclR family transcriptional regulator